VIVDTSALIAVLKAEPDHALFTDALQRGGLQMSAASYLETAIVADRHPNPLLSRGLDQLIETAGILIVPVTAAQVQIARAAHRDFGRGSGHAARLNFGDCFAYALATERAEPLLYKGDDFGHTDVRSAIASP